MELENFNFETIAKYGLIPIFKIRAEERVDTGSTFNEQIKRRTVDQVSRRRRLSDILSDVDGFISGCLNVGIKRFCLVGMRGSDIDALIRVITSYLKVGVLYKHDEFLKIVFKEDGSFQCQSFYMEVDEWKFTSRVTPSGAAVDISIFETNEILEEARKFDLELGRK